MKHTWKRLLSVALAAVMMFTLAVPSYASASGGKSVSWEKIANRDPLSRLTPFEKAEDTPLYADDEVVRVSIILSGESTIDAGYSTARIGENADAMSYRQGLKNDQEKVTAMISRIALGGAELNVVWNLTLVANAISANVEYGRIEAIKAVPGVKDVILENRYEPAVVSKDADDPDMSIASDMVGGNSAWAAGYTGAGSKVAVCDTGLDINHELFDAAAFEYAIEESGKDVKLMTAEDVAAVWDQLNASKFIKDPESVYVNAKIPFGVNYIDRDLDITHENDTSGDHGSHVSGITTANRFIEKDGEFVPSLETVLTQGEAPDAQIFVMKVFGRGGGAYDSDYMAAIEDAIVLGADSVNLSLGSGSAGFVTSNGYQDIMDSLVDSDTVVAMSAGNSYSWVNSAVGGLGGYTGSGYLYSDDVNFDTTGSPGSFTNSLAVASVNNDGVTGMYLNAFDQKIFYAESAGYGNAPIASIAGEYGFVYVDGPGVEDNDYSGNAFEAIGTDLLTGKIAICNRGSSSFFAKANAAIKQGAVAAIIANNQPGVINMNLTGYEYTAPAISITQADGAFLKANAEKIEVEGVEYDVYTGTITVSDSIDSAVYGSEYYTMSDFSSWGVPGDLSLKPEITAPGGNIYSAHGHNFENGEESGGSDQYVSYSGTSMAAPQVTGLAAVLAEYIREEGLTEKTGLSQRALINSLLMSTAEPLIEEESGSYYSILKQGAGLIDVNAALNANSYVLMNEDATASYADGKVKVELGDDPDRTGEYTFSFTLNNLSDRENDYTLSGEFFTQDAFAYYTFNTSGEVVKNADGSPAVSTYLDTLTAALDADVTFTVDGEEIEPADTFGLDFNGDGIFDKNDAKAILELVVNGTPLADETGADMDEDGDIDTYDAYLALQYVSGAIVSVPANGTVEVTVDVKLNDIDDFDDNGAYIEGYIFAQEADTEDGAIGVTHSIPVLGYYGSWSEPRMTDHSDYWDYYALGSDPRTPYLAGIASSPEAFVMNVPGSSDLYLMGGNPISTLDVDEGGNTVHLEERNAVGEGATIGGLVYTQIRNAAASRLTVTNDNTGETLFEMNGGPSYSAYYYVNGAAWRNTGVTIKPSFKVTGLEDDTPLTISYQMAPEYYLENGEMNWDAVHENSIKSATVYVDSTAPELQNIESATDEDGAVTGLSFDVAENRYIAYVAVWNEAGWNDLEAGKPLYEEAGDVTEEKGATRTVSIESGTEDGAIDLSADENQHLMIEVWDYAMNVASYKVNLNTEELESGEFTMTLPEDEISLIKNNSYQIVPEFTPWGCDETVAYTSADESIATVSPSGLVTAVGSGETEITVTPAADPEQAATLIVNVVEIHKNLNGIVWDEDGAVWFTQFDVGELPAYEKLNAENMRKELTSAFYDEEGTLYAITLDNENMLSDLYTVNEEDYSVELVGSNAEIGFMDACMAPSLGEDHFLAVYGTYVLIVNKTTAGYEGAFDLSSYTGGSNLVGIAYEEQYEHPNYGNTDWVWLLDEAGNLYNTGFLPYGGSYSRFAVTAIGNIGDAVDTPYWQSLYYDGASLFWSRFNQADNKVDIITVNDIYEDGSIYNLGSFADSVWPVGGLYEKDKLPYEFGGGEESGEDRTDAVIEAEAEMGIEIEPIQASGSAAEGGLNRVNTSNGPIARPNALESDLISTAVVTVKADEATTNGLYTVEYDPDILELDGVGTGAELSVINMEKPGKIVFGYATLEEIAKDDTVFEATFHYIVSNEPDETVVTVTAAELNDQHTEDQKPEEVTFGAHKWGEPEWTWAEDNSSATAKFTCEYGAHVEEVEATVTSEVVEAACEEAGKTVYTATAEFNGETYTDTQEEEIPATGHEAAEAVKENEVAPTCEEDGSYDEVVYCSVCGKELSRTTVTISAIGHAWGEPEWTWTEDFSSAAVTFTCENDPEHVETVEATVASEITEPTCEEAGKGVYTATAEFNGETYTDTQEAEIPATGHAWGEPEWTWTDDYSTATAKFVCASNAEHVEEIEATVTKQVSGEKTTFVATVELDGVTYTDRMVVITEEVIVEVPNTPSEPSEPSQPAEDEFKFIDVPEDAWYYDDVYEVYEKGFMDATGEDTFSPLLETTREEIVTILWKLAGKPDPKTTDNFSDSTGNPAIEWAAENGIAKGRVDANGAITFAPDANVTRQELAVFFYRYAQSHGAAAPAIELTFDDTADIADWAIEAVRWCVENKIMNGTGNNMMTPNGTATRCELAAMALRMDANFNG